MHYAHSTGNLNRSDWHPLREHLNAVGALAAASGQKFGAGKAAALAGVLHDLGKYTEAFQRRLSGSADRVDHSTAGAQEIGRLAKSGWDGQIAGILAYGIAGHHAGLPDGQGASGCLTDRLKRDIPPLDAAWRNELTIDATELLPAGFHLDRDRIGFQLGFLGRMLFSCLVDADYRDTEAFYAQTKGISIDRNQPALYEIVESLIARFDTAISKKRAEAGGGAVNLLRDEILAHVRSRASAETGLFTLTVPTGGGKTLASLAFALDHAREKKLDRIIYAIPFTSVIDQTVQIFRDILGQGIVLEHHSAIDEERCRERESRDKLNLAMENWAVPVVVTTNVQLFESVFANRPSRCRKLHNLGRSVIVLDEAQTIPLPVLNPCVAAIDELARNYGSSIVLCTATQPALTKPSFVGGFTAETVRELAPDPERLSRQLKRVSMRRAGVLTDDQLLDELAATSQGLIIVNSRAHALDLYQKATAAAMNGVMHLTTRQYAAHRRRILDDVRERLCLGGTCRLIATSLVEAGIDLDFPLVWRAEAGLDQIAQAAGRCNREGRRPPANSMVTVFKPAEYKPPPEIGQLAAAYCRVAERQADLLSLAAIRDFFREVYWFKDKGLDEHDVIAAFKAHAAGVDFAYRSVAENFRLIESGLAPVVIALEKAPREALKKLENPATRPGPIARALQPYLVQVPPKARAQLVANEHVRVRWEDRFGDQFAVLETNGLYREDKGLLWADADGLGFDGVI